MTYYHLEPEVAGGIGERTVLDRSGPRLRATSLHYEFDGWLGDDLLAGQVRGYAFQDYLNCHV